MIRSTLYECPVFILGHMSSNILLHKKWNPLGISGDLLTFTNEILNRKLHFLFNVCYQFLSPVTFTIVLNKIFRSTSLLT